ncbi:MAG: ABC transporter permease, partial [Vicinamibacteria bacterium]|nr:ABC transporter permease [Vicinamibacteria bacterium]
PEVSPIMIAGFVSYFVLGYFFYSLLYAAVGASVNSVQEAQPLLPPIILPQVAAIVFMTAVIQNPDSTLATVLSLIPPLTPAIMFTRIVVLTPPLWQIALSIALMLLSIALLVFVTARIYRVGILMYGKRVTLPELIRWARLG